MLDYIDTAVTEYDEEFQKNLKYLLRNEDKFSQSNDKKSQLTIYSNYETSILYVEFVEIAK